MIRQNAVILSCDALFFVDSVYLPLIGLWAIRRIFTVGENEQEYDWFEDSLDPEEIDTIQYVFDLIKT